MFPGLRLFCFSLLVHAARGSNRAILTNSAVDLCSCQKSCIEQPDSEQPEIVDISIPFSSSSSPFFYFDVTFGSCVHLPRWCKTNLKCMFTGKADCEARCGSVAKLGEDRVGGDSDVVAKAGSKLGGCESTKFGCCSDGSTRMEIGLCRRMDRAGDVGSAGVRWDLVVSGVCVMVLLVMVLTVTGVFTYSYRRKKRERIRSRYIHNVLEMYDSSDSDSSCTDGERGRRSGTRSTKHHRLEL